MWFENLLLLVVSGDSFDTVVLTALRLGYPIFHLRTGGKLNYQIVSQCIPPLVIRRTNMSFEFKMIGSCVRNNREVKVRAY